MRLTPAGLVVIPLAVISAVTGLILLGISLSDRIVILSHGALLISAILVYAATVFFLGRSGIATIRALEARAIIDPLTRLPNRHALHEGIQHASQGSEEVALAVIDLDGFKQVNDHYGHAVGDQLIERCAQMIREVCASEARSYRLGGDEFAVMMTGKVAGTILEGICRTLLERMAVPVEVGHRHIAVGASIGLTRSTAAERLPSSEMLRRSDVAMYMSKRGGRMRCTWFNESFDRRRERMREIEDEIRTGIANSEFHLAYQPLVDAETRRIVAVEALLRWDRGNRPPLGPNVFIPVAEESGLINPLGHSVRALYDRSPALREQQRASESAMLVQVSAIEAAMTLDASALLPRVDNLRANLEEFRTNYDTALGAVRNGASANAAVQDTAAQGSALVDASAQLAADLAARGQSQETTGIAYFFNMVLILGILALMGGAVLLIGLAYLSRDFSRKIVEITDAMTRLADGDRNFDIEGQDRRDEIGAMIRALDLFKRASKRLESWARERSEKAEQEFAAQVLHT